MRSGKGLCWQEFTLTTATILGQVVFKCLTRSRADIAHPALSMAVAYGRAHSFFATALLDNFWHVKSPAKRCPSQCNCAATPGILRSRMIMSSSPSCLWIRAALRNGKLHRAGALSDSRLSTTLIIYCCTDLSSFNTTLEHYTQNTTYKLSMLNAQVASVLQGLVMLSCCRLVNGCF
jgi:hypothetical protein